MTRTKLQWVDVLAHSLHHSLEVINALALQALEHNNEYTRENLGVVLGSVMVEIAYFVMVYYGIELMVFKLGVYVF